MTGFLLAVFAVLLAVLFAVLRAGYGDLRVSELPVLMLALLAGSGERGRLRLILSHREDRGQARAHVAALEAIPAPVECDEQRGAFGTVADLRRERRTRPARMTSVRDSQARSESFWQHIEEARRLTGQIKAANGIPPAAIGDETADDDEHRSNLRWERPS